MMKFIVIISVVLVIIIYLMFYYPSYEITKQIPAVCTGKWMNTHNHPIQFITKFRAPNNQILEFNNSDCFLNENVRSGDTYLLDVNICVRGNRIFYRVSNIHNLCS